MVLLLQNKIIVTFEDSHRFAELNFNFLFPVGAYSFCRNFFPKKAMATNGRWIALRVYNPPRETSETAFNP